MPGKWVPPNQGRLKASGFMNTGINGGVLRESCAQTGRQIVRSKCTYCLGCCSCLIVVLVGATLQTLLSQAPLIFLREAESSVGQVDMTMAAEPWTNNIFLNYTLLSSVMAESPDADELKFHAPRHELDAVIQNPSDCQTGNVSDPSAPRVYASTQYDYAQDNTWMYDMGEANVTTYCLGNCMGLRCQESQRMSSTLYLIDSAKEEAMGYGRDWEQGVIPPGQAVLLSSQAEEIGVEEGDTMFVRVSIPEILRVAYRPKGAIEGQGNSGEDGAAPSNGFAWGERTLFHGQVVLSVKVFAIVSASGGKAENRRGGAGFFMEYGSFGAWTSPRLHPLIRHVPGDLNSANPEPDLYQVASTVVLNMPPETRLEKYLDSNYDSIQREVATFGSAVMYLVGFAQVNSDLPILESLRRRRFVTLYLGLVMDILLFILFGLSTILIYSLLQINVSSRTFELAIRRMIGTTRAILVLLLVTQALSYSVPALVIGLLLAQVFSSLLMDQFASLSGIPVTAGLTGGAVLLGFILATAIPLLASIGPIRGALSRSLRDALDIYRPKSQAITFKIERAEDAGVPWSIVAIGTTLSVFGFCIYYLIPLSLLSLNLSLFFNVFFGILVAMLFGLVLLALNMEITLEKAVVYCTLWWDKAVMRRLAISNLVSHRVRNRKTMIMYALSIAFIVFISTAANLQIQSTEYRVRQEAGCQVYVETENVARGGTNPATIAALEALVQSDRFKDGIVNTAWVSHSLSEHMKAHENDISEPEISNVGHVYADDVHVNAVSPSFSTASLEEFYTPGNVSTATGLTMSEQLYTIAGSQGIALSSYMKDQVGAAIGTTVLLHQEYNSPQSADTSSASGVIGTQEVEVISVLRRIKSYQLIDSAPVFDFSEFAGRGESALVSFPTLVRYTRGTVEDVSGLSMWRFMILTNDDFEDYDELVAALEGVLATRSGGWEVHNIEEDLDDLSITQTVLNFLFTTMSIVALFLCFFSLVASMVTNIREQTKEAGVLRALGLGNYKLIRLFVYEAYALVLASSLMGVGIGVMVGWTFSQQQALFTELPVGFFVPWDIIVTICIASVVCSILAAAIPGSALTKVRVTKLLRTMT